jgi:hypothetical protein
VLQQIRLQHLFYFVQRFFSVLKQTLPSFAVT